MPQLHCYVPDKVARQLRERAERAKMPLSRYLAILIQRDLEQEWPEGYFDLFGGWQGEPLERSPQGDYESRAGFG
ncbi:MAG: hypothetical protein VX663_07905 [Pseudomonadota bacterium]|nr:hypothetical protein [Pseudomonadota bacterium]